MITTKIPKEILQKRNLNYFDVDILYDINNKIIVFVFVFCPKNIKLASGSTNLKNFVNEDINYNNDIYHIKILFKTNDMIK